MAFDKNNNNGKCGDPNNFAHSTKFLNTTSKVLTLGAGIGAGVTGAWFGIKELFFKPVKPIQQNNHSNNFKPKRR